ASARLGRERDVGGHELAVDLDAQIEHPVGKPARRLMLERHVDVAGPEIGRLDDVQGAVQHAEAVLRHRHTSLVASEPTTSQERFNRIEEDNHGYPYYLGKASGRCVE